MKDKLHFYVMAHGSLTELENQIIIAQDLDFINKSSYDDLMSLIERTDIQLSGLIKSTKGRV